MHQVRFSEATRTKAEAVERSSLPGQSSLLYGVLIGVAGLLATMAYLQSHLIPPKLPLRIAINPWPGYEFATLAREKGFFEAEGLDVRLVELSSLGDCRRAFERGQVDGFFSTLVEVLQSRTLSKRCAQIVMVADYSNGADVILAKNSVSNVADLRGKRIAVEECSLNEYLLARALQLEAIPIHEIELLHLAQLEMPRALARGEIDAVVTYPPISVGILSSGEAHAVFSSKDIPGEVIDVLSFDDTVLQERREEIAAFLRAFFQAQDFAAEHAEDAWKCMAARERISVEEFRETLNQGIHIVTRDEQQAFISSPGRLTELLRRVTTLLSGIGHLEETVDLADLVVNVESHQAE